MDTSMVERVQEKHWYLAVGDRSIGPLTTALVTRGIESGKVPLTAWICQVGADAWSALSSFGEFQDVVDRVLSSEVPANQQGPGRYAQQNVAPAFQSAATPVSSMRAHSQPAAPCVALSDQSEEQPAAVPYAFEPTALSEGQAPLDPEPPPLAYELDEQALPSFADEAEGGLGDSDLVTSASLPLEMAQEYTAREELPSVDEQSGPREVPPELRPTPLFDPAVNANGVDEYATDTIGADANYYRSEAPMEFSAGAVIAESVEHDLHDELGIDITFEEDEQNTIDWSERFQSYFLVGTEVELPEEAMLLQSLHETPRATFLHDEALWNLSLCLAFGSDEVAATSARTFFEAIAYDQASERIEWICRTLLSKGFMPSGIPRGEGRRGIDLLRMTCPVDLLDVLDREAMD